MEDIHQLHDEQQALIQTITTLMDRMIKLEQNINMILRPDRYVFERPIVGGALGLKIGQTTSSKVGFYGKTPIVPPNTTGTVSGHTAVGGATIGNADTFTGNVGSAAYTLNDIVANLKNIGLLAS